MENVAPGVLSQEVILQPASITHPERGELLSHPTGPTDAAWDAVGGRVSFCHGTPTTSSASATHGQAWPLVGAG